MIKKVIQSRPESYRRKGRSQLDARSVLSVREHGKMATCLREAAPAKAGNSAGGFFQHSHLYFHDRLGYSCNTLMRYPR